MSDDITLHSNMLSYARSLQVGEALFYGRYADVGSVINDGALNREALRPALVQEISVRGQISNYVSENSTKEFNLEAPNLQTIDKARLPVGADGLVVKFSLQFLPNTMQPHACDDDQVMINLTDFAERYAARGGFKVITPRILWNIVSGRFMWRNYMIMEDKVVHILEAGQCVASVDPTAFGHHKYPGDNVMRDKVPGFDGLVDKIAHALSGDRPVVSWEIICEGSLPELSEVFPSEEYLAGEKADSIQRRRGSPNGPGKVLSSVERRDPNGEVIRQPSFHPQKVGNALRVIDEWHGHERHGAVAADPYAALTTRAIALRSPGNGSLYDFLTVKKRRQQMLTTLDSESPDSDAYGDLHFVFGNLLRGGVFGGKE